MMTPKKNTFSEYIKSRFNPNKGRNNTLDALCETLENSPLHSNTSNKIKPNIAKPEEKALKDFVTNFKYVENWVFFFKIHKSNIINVVIEEEDALFVKIHQI
jgi:hypothetical protein